MPQVGRCDKSVSTMAFQRRFSSSLKSGGIGGNALMLPLIRETVNRLSYPTEIAASALGPDATVLGIEKIAADHACELLVGSLPA